MKRALKNLIFQYLDEESAGNTDEELLNTLRQLAARDSDYFSLPVERRNALNDFFSSVKDTLFSELFQGTYGVQILLDSFFILCFEVGYRLHEVEAAKGEGEPK